MKFQAAALFAIWLGAACAPRVARPYQEERAAAERAYAAGRYDEAAEHWKRAEQKTNTKRDKNEARYRAAVSLRRAGRNQEAAKLLESLVAQHPKSSRAPRAAFDRADIEIDHGDAERGWTMLEHAMRTYPKSGLAHAALERLVQREAERSGEGGAIAYLERLKAELAPTELAERIEYGLARELDKAGRSEQALAGYLAVAQRFPYPRGALWDDALWNASLIEERLGRPEQAIAHLERMLAEREPSSLGQGSYERPRYAQARFRIAELYRDRLKNPERARREFRRVWDEHPSSILRDDALWQEARIERESGELDRACSTLALLKKKAAESRYAACVRAICPSLPEPKGTSGCHAYILRALEGGKSDER